MSYMEDQKLLDSLGVDRKEMNKKGITLNGRWKLGTPVLSWDMGKKILRAIKKSR